MSKSSNPLCILSSVWDDMRARCEIRFHDSRTATCVADCGTLPHLALFLIRLGDKGSNVLVRRQISHGASFPGFCVRQQGSIFFFFPACSAISVPPHLLEGPNLLAALTRQPGSWRSYRFSLIWLMGGGSTSTRSNTGLLQPHLKLSYSNRISRQPRRRCLSHQSYKAFVSPWSEARGSGPPNVVGDLCFSGPR